ncbi:MAG: putative lipid II flippase FtsW [Clostridiales Family XIII bacterium]|jgi:cell division protein FtsW|nr:putative lipid II flippase FtsW [Clostridiales Family XIII bacterium]
MKKPATNRIDIILLIMVVVLVIFGVVMVFSASYYDTMADNLSPYHYLIRAAFWAGAGAVCMVILAAFPYKKYMRFAVPIMIIGVVLLVLLFVPGIGETRNHATRWIKIGPLTFMPGEYVKFAVIVFVAWYYTKYAQITKTFTKGFIPMIALVGVLFVLIYKQPNLSTALIICLTIVCMMFLSGVRIPYIAGTALLGIFGVIFLILSAGAEHLNRVTGFLHPFEDAQGEFYQTVQGLLALGSGGVYGVGLGHSVQKALWLPEAQNDFIFAIIGEEIGFVGCIIVLIAFLTLIWRCAVVSLHAPDRFSMLLGSGITVLLALQVILNIMVVTSIAPPTGITLPFISYGGNAMVLFMGLMGIMLNISNATYKAQRRHERLENAI